MEKNIKHRIIDFIAASNGSPSAGEVVLGVLPYLTGSSEGTIVTGLAWLAERGHLEVTRYQGKYDLNTYSLGEYKYYSRDEIRAMGGKRPTEFGPIEGSTRRRMVCGAW